MRRAAAALEVAATVFRTGDRGRVNHRRLHVNRRTIGVALPPVYNWRGGTTGGQLARVTTGGSNRRRRNDCGFFRFRSF